MTVRKYALRRGNKDGAEVRTPDRLPPMGPDSSPARCYMWVEFGVIFRLRFSPLSPPDFFGFSTSTKTNTPNFKSTRIEDSYENQPKAMRLPPKYCKLYY